MMLSVPGATVLVTFTWAFFLLEVLNSVFSTEKNIFGTNCLELVQDTFAVLVVPGT